METSMAAKQCEDSETNIKVEKQPNGRVRVVIEDLSIAGNMMDVEEGVLQYLNRAGTAIIKEALQQHDVEGDPLLRSGKWTSKGQYTETYETYFGKAEVKRHVYQSSEGGKTYCPLEEKAQVIEGATPKFAKTLSSKYAHLGVGRVKADLLDNHGRSISATYVQRVSDAVGLLLTTKGERWQYALPDDLDRCSVKALSVGIDGTCVLAVEGGYKQAMAGTISLLNRDGDRLHTIYVGSAPESGKKTFLRKMRKELSAVIKEFPKATVVGVADGARDNWEFLNEVTDRQIIDFFHVAEYLNDAAGIICSNDVEKEEWLSSRCHDLKHKSKTARAIIIELRDYLARKRLRTTDREIVQKTLTYFENNRRMMNYPAALKDNLPIGSGVTEAACKVLVKQRLGGAGMRWTSRGAHVVLQLRAAALTNSRWNAFWRKISLYGVVIEADCTA